MRYCVKQRQETIPLIKRALKERRYIFGACANFYFSSVVIHKPFNYNPPFKMASAYHKGKMVAWAIRFHKNKAAGWAFTIKPFRHKGISQKLQKLVKCKISFTGKYACAYES